MSLYQHRRNFSLLATQCQNQTKIKLKNNSLRKIQTNHNYSWFLVAAKQYYHKTSNLTAAIDNFQQYLTYYPNHQQSLYLCAVCYMNIEQYSKAIQKLKQYLTAKRINTGNTVNNRKLIINSSAQLPNTSHVYLLLSMAYNKINNIGKSMENINQALKNDNKFQQAYCFRAKLYLRLNQEQRAFYDYKQALKINAGSWTAWVGLGDYYTQNNNYAQALKCYQKAQDSMQNQKKVAKSKNSFQQFAQQQQQILPKPLTNQYRPKLHIGISKSNQKFTQKRDSRVHQKLQQFIRRPRQRIFKQTNQIQQQQQKGEQKQKPKLKLTLHSVTSPSCRPSLIKSIFPQHQQSSQTQPKPHQYKQKHIKTQQTIIQKQNQSQSTQEIKLKIAICFYFLAQYNKSIQLLKQMLNQKANGFLTEIYYYLAVNQMKVYDEFKVYKLQACKNVPGSTKFNKQEQPNANTNANANANRNNKNNANMKKQAIIINAATSSTTSNQPPLSPLSPLSLNPLTQVSYSQILQQSILNLQSSIRANNNKKIMTKACKTLLKLYIQNNQYYQTDAVLKLAQKYQIQLGEYKILSQVCMMVIKQKYQQALPILKRLYQVIVKNNHNISLNYNSSTNPNNTNADIINNQQQKNRKKQQTNKRAKQKQKQKQKQKHSNKQQTDSKTQYLQAQNIKISQTSRQFQMYSRQNQFEQPLPQKQSMRQYQIVNSTGNQRTRNRVSFDLGDEELGYNQFRNIALRNKLDLQKIDNNVVNANTSINNNQLQWMRPVVLLFRAYSQYFSDNFIQCLQIYEHYENYIKDYLGMQPQMDIYLSYNKILCEGILMLDNDMIEESLEKFMQCVENYYKLVNSVAAQPILFRILGMIRLAISQNPVLSDDINNRCKVYQLILEIIDHYMPAINNNPLAHYYYALALYQLERYKQASDSLQKCLKLAEQCTWKFLYVKGVVQIKNKLYKDAIRQFSAGLLVQQKAQIYLGRCICYLRLYDQLQGEHQAYMQKSFEDLQKFIQLQSNKDKISLWVTKLLFFNKAYEQVTKSIKKVSNHVLQNDEALLKIQKCLNIYNGIFQSGGVLGQILMNAFQGKFDQSSIQINGERHQIHFTDFVSLHYKKWLTILSLYSTQKYQELIKFLQLTIFQQKNQQQTIQLRYDLAIVYYLSGEPGKADNILSGLPKICPQIGPRVEKFLKNDFVQDQCVDDLQKQLKGIKRLSSFLNYRKIKLNTKSSFSLQPAKSIFVKISAPFPSFFKPEIDLSLDDQFIYGQTAQSCIPKKIEAPWIKKVTGNIQFTDNVVDSHNTSFFENDVLSPGTQSKQQSSILSSIKKF